MIKFRNVVGSSQHIAWWDNDQNQIAFCRGIRGFIAFNNEEVDMNQRLFTCMPSGIYCDVITGQREGLKCTGGFVIVDENGEANIYISTRVGVLAIHVEVCIIIVTIENTIIFICVSMLLLICKFLLFHLFRKDCKITIKD